MRIHKEMFCALVQFRVESLTSNYDTMDAKLKELFLKLKSDPSSQNLDEILHNPEFESLSEEILKTTEGTESEMTIAYLKDVSSMLALVSAVRDNNLELHLQAEREMVKHCFAFDNVN